MKGMRTMASLLHKTLIEVKISCCENPSAVASLRSLEPLQDLIERLHVDCVRDGCEEHEHASKKKCKYSSHPDFSSCELSNGNRILIFCKSRKGLKYLSLWISAGELLTPLPMTGLDAHPNLEEIRIRVERDCRSGHKPSNR